MVEVKEQIDTAIEDHSAATRALLEKAGIDVAAIPDMDSHLGISHNPFQELETAHQQKQYYLKNLGLAVSIHL